MPNCLTAAAFGVFGQGAAVWSVQRGPYDRVERSFYSPGDRAMASYAAEDNVTHFTKSYDLLDAIAGTGVAIEDQLAVATYLAAHGDMNSAVQFACEKAMALKRPDSRLSLMVTRDTDGGSDELVICLRRPHYSEDVVDEIDRIVSAFGDRLSLESGPLYVVTDFATVAE